MPGVKVQSVRLVWGVVKGRQVTGCAMGSAYECSDCCDSAVPELSERIKTHRNYIYICFFLLKPCPFDNLPKTQTAQSYGYGLYVYLFVSYFHTVYLRLLSSRRWTRAPASWTSNLVGCRFAVSWSWSVSRVFSLTVGWFTDQGGDSLSLK